MGLTTSGHRAADSQSVPKLGPEASGPNRENPVTHNHRLHNSNRGRGALAPPRRDHRQALRERHVLPERSLPAHGWRLGGWRRHARGLPPVSAQRDADVPGVPPWVGHGVIDGRTGPVPGAMLDAFGQRAAKGPRFRRRPAQLPSFRPEISNIPLQAAASLGFHLQLPPLALPFRPARARA